MCHSRGVPLMMQELSEVLKRNRHALGKLVLVLGSGIPLRPGRLSNLDRVNLALADYAKSLRPSAAGALTQDMVDEITSGLDPDPESALRFAAPHFRDLEPSEGHLRLARLIKEGFFPTVVSTGIDDLLERALEQMHMHPEEHYNLVNVAITTKREIAGALAKSRRVTVLKALGTVGGGAFALTRRQVQSHLRRIQRFIYDSARATVIYVGYSERDADLIAAIGRDGGQLWWVNPRIPVGDPQVFDTMKTVEPEALPHHELLPAVVDLMRSRRSERLLIVREQGDFDAFFRELYVRRVRRTHDPDEFGRPRESLALEPDGPYKFLEPLEVRDSSIFHGRDRELETLEKLIESKSILVIYGRPGVGKTSLAQAGLLASAARDGAIPVTVRVGTDPRRETVLAIARAIEDAEDCSRIDEGMSVAEAASATGGRVVLLIDQAEELFTRIGRLTMEAYARQLAEWLAEQNDSRLVLTIGDAGFSLLYDLLPYLPDIYGAVLRLGPLSRANARQVVVKSAARFERRWEDELVEELLDDLGHDQILPAALALVCHHTYATLRRRERVLILRAYEAIGRAERVLKTFFTDALQGLGWRDRDMARQLLRAMIRSGGTRGPLTRDQIVARCPRIDADRVERLLWALIDARLVHRLGREPERTYEFVHEWLMPIIGEGVSDEERADREVEDAVSRALTDWRLCGEPMDLHTLRQVHSRRSRLHLTKEELAFVIRSSAYRNYEYDRWVEETGQLGEEGVDLLREILWNAPEAAQMRTVRRLDMLGTTKAVKVLVDALGELSPAVDSSVQQALEGRGHAVAAAIRESSGQERASALAALGTVGSTEAVEPLVEVLGDATEDASVREAAVAALTTIAPRLGGRASARLIETVSEIPSSSIDEERARALARVATAEGETGTLMKAADTKAQSPTLRYSAVLAAIEARDPDKADEALAVLLRDSPEIEGSESLGEARRAIAELRARLAAGHFEWSMFRKDPAHTGVAWEDGPITPATIWRARLPGQVIGSPAVSRGECFIGGRDGTLVALDALTGREIWSRQLGLGIESSPAVTDDLVVVGSLDHRVYACDRKSGRPRWRTETGGEVRGSPTIAGDAVLVGSWDGHLYCISLDSGTTRWKALVGGPIYGAPAVADGRVFIGSWAGRVVCLDTASGQELFSVNAGAEVSSSPAVSPEGRVVVGCDSGEVLVFAADSPHVHLRYHTGGPVRSSPAICDGVVYIGSGDGCLHAFEIVTGETLLRFETAEAVTSSPAVTPSHVVFGSRDGCLLCISRQSGEEVYRVVTPYSVISSPAVVGGIVYVGMEYYELHAIGGEQRTQTGA